MVVLMVLVSLYILDFRLFNWALDNYVDAVQATLAKPVENLPLKVVVIDDETIARHGEWPWPRDRMAMLLDRIASHGPRVVGVDVVFLDRTGSNDAALARAIAKAPMVLAREIGVQSDDPAARSVEAPVVWLGPRAPERLPLEGDVLARLSEPIHRAASGVGLAIAKIDGDGVIRGIPILVRVGDRIVPSFEAEITRHALDAAFFAVRGSGDPSQAMLNGIGVGDIDIPINHDGNMRINYGLELDTEAIPAWRLLEPGDDAPTLEGDVVLVGVGAANVGRQWLAPDRSYRLSLSLHARAMATILSGQFLTRPAWMPTTEKAVVLILLVGALLLNRRRERPSLLLTGVAIIVPIGISLIGYRAGNLLISPIGAVILIGAHYGLAVIRASFTVSREKQELRQAFERYVAPDVVASLLADPSRLHIGGQTRLITVMFCDIRNFTGIAEALTAEELAGFMQRFFTYCSEIILAERGTIDKYVGDCVIAFWNAPLEQSDHATMACIAARRICDGLPALRQSLPRAFPGKAEQFAGLSVGIGINSGVCSVGNMGSEERFNYTVMGDAVNIAARLEEFTKTVSAPILIGEETRALLTDIPTREIGPMSLRGRSRPVTVSTIDP